MRIHNNSAAMSTLRTLANTDRSMTRAIGRLSSGFRINRASDDAAGLAIANQMKADLGAMRQATRNAEQATSLMQVAEGGATGIQDVLVRMKELASQAASDNVDATGRGRIDIEYQELLVEIDRIANSTEFSGVNLLNDTAGATTLEFVVGASSTIANDKITLAAFDLTTAATGLNITGTDLLTDANAETVLTSVDVAITAVSDAFATIGAKQNRLDIALNQVRITVENTAAAESVIRDADMAAEVTELTKFQILSQAGTSVLAQANLQAQSVLSLLQ